MVGEDFRTGLWRVERGAIPGCPLGSLVALERTGEDVRLTHPGESGGSTLPKAVALAGPEVDRGWLNLTSRSLGWTIVLSPAEATNRADVAPGPPPAALVRTYPGVASDEASAAMAADSRLLAASGYRVASQSWAAPERHLLTAIAGLLLLFAGLFFWFANVVVFLFVVGCGVALLAIGAPTRPGALTVSYELREPPIQRPAREGPSPGRSARERLLELEGLRSEHLISEEEYATRRAAILEAI